VPIVDKLLALDSRQYAVWCHKDVLSASSRLSSPSGVKTSHLFCFIWKFDETVCHTLVNIAFISSDGSDSIAFNWRGEDTKGSEGWVSHSPFANLLVILLWSWPYTFIDMEAYLSIFQYRHCAWTQRESHRDMDRSQDKSVLAQRLSFLEYCWCQSHDIWLQCWRRIWEYNSEYQWSCKRLTQQSNQQAGRRRGSRSCLPLQLWQLLM